MKVLPKNDLRSSAMFLAFLRHFSEKKHNPCLTLSPKTYLGGKVGSARYGIGCVECGLSHGSISLDEAQLESLYQRPLKHLLQYRVFKELQKTLLEPAIEPVRRSRFDRI
jgi:hypothetical protein